MAQFLKLFEFVFSLPLRLQIALDAYLLPYSLAYDVIYASILVCDSLGSGWAAIVLFSEIVLDLGSKEVQFGPKVAAAAQEMSLAVAEEASLPNDSLVIIQHLLLFHQVKGFLSQKSITLSS